LPPWIIYAIVSSILTGSRYTVEDLAKVEILPEPGPLIDFIIEGANHMDLLYGKKAQKLVHPLLNRIIEGLWADWSYDEQARKYPEKAGVADLL